MASPKLLEFQARARRQHQPWHGKGYAPSREAPKYDGLTFQRQQSRDMAARDWEKPIEPMWASILAGALVFAGIGMVIFASLIL